LSQWGQGPIGQHQFNYTRAIKKGPEGPLDIESRDSGLLYTGIMYTHFAICRDQAAEFQRYSIKRGGIRIDFNTDKGLFRTAQQAGHIQSQQPPIDGEAIDFHTVVVKAQGQEITEHTQVQQAGIRITGHETDVHHASEVGIGILGNSQPGTTRHIQGQVHFSESAIHLVQYQFRRNYSAADTYTEGFTGSTEIGSSERFKRTTSAAGEAIHIAHITGTVFIRIGLIRIGCVGAVVAHITDTIRIHIRLIRVRGYRAVIIIIGDAITIVIVFTDVANSIAIRIFLAWVGDQRAVITDIADAVTVTIFLARVRDYRTVIGIIGDTITVFIIRTGITDTIAVAVVLVCVRDQRAVVGVIRNTIPIGVVFIRTFLLLYRHVEFKSELTTD